MGTIQRIARNATVLLIAQVLSNLMAFFYMMYIARYLGATGFGIISFAIAFTGIFGVLVDFGLQPLTVREVARDKSLASKYLANTALMKIILAFITFGLVALAINIMGYTTQTIEVVFLVTLYVIFTSFTQMFNSIFRAYERMEFESIGYMINSALILAGVILAMKLGFSVVGFASLFALASFVIPFYCFAILRRKISNPSVAWSPRKLEIDWHFWKPTIKEALPFCLSTLFSTVFFWVDSVMLSYIKGDSAVGWYNAAYRIMFALLLIPTTFRSVILPVMSKFYITSESSLRLSHEKFFKYMVVLGVPIAVGITLLSQRLILLIFGTEYTNSITTLQVLMWSAVFIFMNIPFATLFAALNRQEISTKISGLALALNVILNIVLIPRYSLIGASISSLATQFLVAALSIAWGARIGYPIPAKKLTGIMIKVCTASALMGIFVFYLHNLNLVLLVLAGAFLYFGLLYLVRGIYREDILLIRDTIRTS